MEPLGIAGSIISVLQTAGNVLKNLGPLKDDIEYSPMMTEIRRYENALVLLKHIQDNISSLVCMEDLRAIEPIAVIVRDQLAPDLAMLLEEITKKGKSMKATHVALTWPPSQERLVRRVDAFVGAVHLIRDLYFGQRLAHLTANHADVNQRITQVLQLVDNVDRIADAVNRSRREQSHSQQEVNGGINDLEEARDNLHETKEALRAILSSQKPETRRLCFPFNILSQGAGLGTIAAKIQIDTGCEENWIRAAIVVRAGLSAAVTPTGDSGTYSGFAGNQVTPTGQVVVIWFSENERLTRESLFLIHPDVPFDAILGRKSMLEDAGVAFSSPLLALRHSNLSKDELRQIESNAKGKGATNQQIADIRKAADSKRREEKRRTKEASLAPTARNTPYGLSGVTDTPNYSRRCSFSNISVLSALTEQLTERGGPSSGPHSISSQNRDDPLQGQARRSHQASIEEAEESEP